MEERLGEWTAPRFVPQHGSSIGGILAIGATIFDHGSDPAKVLYAHYEAIGGRRGSTNFEMLRRAA